MALADDSVTIQQIQTSGASDIAFSPDGSRVYVATQNSRIHVFDAVTGALVTTWQFGPGFGAMSVSDDGSFLLLTRVESGGPAAIYRVATDTGAVTSFVRASGPYATDVQATDGTHAIVALYGGKMELLDLATGTYTPIEGIFGDGNNTRVFLTDSGRLTLAASSRSTGGEWSVYDEVAGRFVASGYSVGIPQPGFNNGVQSISEGVGLIATYIVERAINIYDLSGNGLRRVDSGGFIDAMTFDSSGGILYYHLVSGEIVALETTNFTEIDRFFVDGGSTVNSLSGTTGAQLDISPDGKHLVYRDHVSGQVFLIDLSVRDQQFAGTSGADAFDGGKGDDVYLVNHAGDTVTELALQGNDRINATIDYSLGAEVQVETLAAADAAATTAIALTGNALDNRLIGNAGINSLSGLVGNDELRGLGGADILNGGDGNDLLLGGAGSDTLNGGAGTDTASYDDLNSGVTVSLAAGSASAPGGDIDTLVSIENIVGSRFGDSLTGDDAVNLLEGAAGDDLLSGRGGEDILDGGTGADHMYGGTGNDKYRVDNQNDLIFESAGEGVDEVTASIGHYLHANVENLTLSATAGGIFGVGNDLANTILGNAESNLLLGGGGDDIVRGGAGVDSLFGEDGADQLFGDAGVDYLVGGAGNDRLNGGDDADALYGQDGDDVLTGGNSFHTDILVGGAGNDILNGLNGRGDYDLMDGGEGNDLYYVDTPDDLTFEAAGGGIDTVLARINGAGYYLYANVENLILDGNTPFGVGNELDNQITGSTTGNYLLGGAGNDRLNGKAGEDVLFGEAGADIFVFESGTGGDVIGDFVRGTDRIDLSAFGFASFAAVQANFSQVGANGAINLGNGDFVVLHNVTMSQLTQGDFILTATAPKTGEFGSEAKGFGAADIAIDGVPGLDWHPDQWIARHHAADLWP
jgi:Ca2+-binding RTX toxin-like protein